MKELLIHFNDVSVCLNNLKELGIKLPKESIRYIEKIHDSVVIATTDIPQKIIAEVCYRNANRILKIVEGQTDVRFVRYKLKNYLLNY